MRRQAIQSLGHHGRRKRHVRLGARRALLQTQVATFRGGTGGSWGAGDVLVVLSVLPGFSQFSPRVRRWTRHNVGMTNFFDVPDETAIAASKTMNGAIKSAFDRSSGTTGAMMAKLTGEAVTPSRQAEALSVALSDSESARRSGNADDMALADHILDERIAAARAARTEQPRDDQGRFDGGVRSTSRGGVKAPAGGQQESANQLFQKMVQQSRQERQEAANAPEQTINL